MQISAVGRKFTAFDLAKQFYMNVVRRMLAGGYPPEYGTQKNEK
jgi:hypothetical protein